MFLTLKPTIRHFALALPVLLTGLPAALGADQDKLGPVLPPPSLYDVPPTGQPASAAPPPPVSTPASTAAPAAPPADQGGRTGQRHAVRCDRKPSRRPKRLRPRRLPHRRLRPQPPLSRPYPGTAVWFTGCSGSLRRRPRHSPPRSPQPTAAVQADASPPPVPTRTVARSTRRRQQGSPPRHYASDASNRSIRAGMTGECVKMGTWTQDAASA